MGDTPTEDDAEDTSNLELPSLRIPGFSRRRQRDRPVPEVSRQPQPEPEPTAPLEVQHPSEPEAVRDPEPDPLQEPEPERAPVRDPEPAVRTRRSMTSRFRRSRPDVESGASAASAPAETADPAPDRPAPLASISEPEPEPTARTETSRPAAREPEPQVVEPDPEVEPGSEEVEPGTGSPRRSFTLPPLAARVAAAVTGVLVGLAGTVLAYLALSACNVARGTRACGAGPGFLLLVVILAVMVALGAVLLALWRVPEPRAVSVLGVGVLCVVVLLTGTGQVVSGWMFVVVPVVTGLGFVAAQWLATALIEPLPEPGPDVDVR